MTGSGTITADTRPEIPSRSLRPAAGVTRSSPTSTPAAVSLTGLQARRSARAAESARLEIVCWATNRGFKSHLLRSAGSPDVRCAVSDVSTHLKGQVIGPAEEGPDFRRSRQVSHTWPIATSEPLRPKNDDEAMVIALAEARDAATEGEVPVGAVCLVEGRVVARRHNERERVKDPTAHAELLALRDAAAALGAWRLADATIVVTLEPCPMCAGALVAARVDRLVYGAADPKAGACGTLYNLCADPRLNHEIAVTRGVRAEECGALLTSFFADRRNDRASGESFGAGQSR